MKHMLETVVREYPNKTALISNGIERTYQEFYERVCKISNALFQMNFYKGDRIAILMSNRAEYFELYFGIFSMGGIAVPLNTRLGLAEIKYILNHAGVNTIVYEDSYKEIIHSMLEELPGVKNLICVGKKDGRSHPFEEIIDAASNTELETDIKEEDIAFLCYTSGTTGKPKGAMITHKNMTQMCSYQLIEFPRQRNFVGMCLFPFFHIGVMMGFNKIALGMTCVFTDFSIEKVGELIEKFQVNDLDITATQLKMFATSEASKQFNLTSLRTVSTGGGFTSHQTLTSFFDLLPNDHDIVVANVYGMTENTAHVMSNMITPRTLANEIEKFRLLPNIKASGLCAGKPIYGMLVKIVNDMGEEQPENEVGEIVVKSDTVLKGYWQEPSKTSKAVIDGWYHTGDLGVRLSNGEYFIIDRKKDMVLTGDENVYSAEVENVLSLHPLVNEVAIIGLPHEVYGEVVTAIVVPSDKNHINEQELKDFCRRQIGGYKIPKNIYFAEQLPRNAAGKILKHKLKNEYSLK
jgi:acyl-CoA synthetase (AMP-forming)/AMP-acid ligase II